MVFCIWCPLGDCKRGGRLLAKAETELAVRERLRAHLWGAPAHAGISDKQREDLVQMATVHEWADDDEAAANPTENESEAPPTKRPRNLPIGKGCGRAQVVIQQHQDELQQQQQQQHQEDFDTIKQAVAAGVMSAMAQGSAPLTLASSSSSSSALRVTLATDVVQLPRGVVANVLDHLTRAEQAARQAHLIAAKAAVAFEAEAGAIANAKAMVETLVRHLGC